VNSPPLRGIAPVGLRPLCAMPRNGNRWKGLVGNPSIGTETLFRPSRLPQAITVYVVFQDWHHLIQSIANAAIRPP